MKSVGRSVSPERREDTPHGGDPRMQSLMSGKRIETGAVAGA
jgi:hypothetical protein